MFMIFPIGFGTNRPAGRFSRGLAIACLLTAAAMLGVVLALPFMVLVSSLL